MLEMSDYFDWADATFDPREAFDKPEALAGVKMVELATLYLGPATGAYLAEYGAEVVKIELPGMGDTARHVAYEGFYWKNTTPALFPQTHNKYLLGLDVHHDEGKEIFVRLAAQSDVVLENFRAGTLDRWGIGYRQIRRINPDVIYVANSGFGQWGPYAAGRPSYDLTAQAMSGLAVISGFEGRPPAKLGLWIGDWLGACLSAVAVMAALHHRRRTGQGQFIDLSQAEGLIRSLDWTWLYHQVTGQDRGRYGNRDVAISPSDIVRCRDGFIAIAAFRQEEFEGLCAAMELVAGDPRFATPQARLQDDHARQLLERVAAWAADKTMDELEQLGTEHGFAAARVMDFAGLYADEHLRRRGTIWTLDDPVYGEVVETGPVIKFSETPGRLKWCAKPVGWHNEYVLTEWLQLTPRQIARLEAGGVIGKWDDRRGAKPPDDWDGQAGLVFPPVSADDVDYSAEDTLPLTYLERTLATANGSTTGYEAGSWAEWIRARNDPRTAAEKPQALDDLLVLDLSEGHMGGLVTSSLLAELGAEVIRVEPPAGDVAREMTPFGIKYHGTGLGYLAEARNKHHITLNLHTEAGRDLLRRLAARADVLIETFRPGRMDAWGLGYRQLSRLNPRLIYAALHVHGQFGPRARWGQPDYDVVNQALSGLVWSSGEPEDLQDPQLYQVPTRAGNWFGWFAGGTWTALGVLIALHHRAASGRGQMIDVSGAEGVLRFMDYYLTLYHMGQINRSRVGPLDPSVFPYTYVKTRDGYAMLAGYTDPNFYAICAIMEQPDLKGDPRFNLAAKRATLANEAELHAELEQWSRHLTAQEILDKAMHYMLVEKGPGTIVTGPVCTPTQVLEDDNWWQRGGFQWVDDPLYGRLLLQAPVWKLSGSPARIKWACRPVGYDNEWVYQKYLGLGAGRAGPAAAA